ncbi:MAG TPA: hypothetical protein P5270_01255 [Victivallales bacterium]|nr:hypothetical protein [Victivallales bacterium]HPO89798.1 hypothetical protein [Victivallales bacterium]HRR27967.1 hypothetical protein [Victivallales bacterium]HRU00657.1 hypothetical protein [Victivallales bacterium]
MKAGDEIQCPHCGKSSFLKKTVIIDGWTKKGEVLSCAVCSAKIADLKSENAAEDKKNFDKLASFLNENEKLPKIEIKSDENEKRFCKDCSHFIKHPFNDKCGLHNKFVNPMDDCKEFKRKN